MRPTAQTPQPGIDLYRKVMGGFVTQGTTLTAWCRKEGLHQSNSRTCLTGSWDGPRARELRARLCKAAGVTGKAGA